MLVGTDVCVRVVFVWEETGNKFDYLKSKITKYKTSCYY